MPIDPLVDNDTHVAMLSRLITKGELGLNEAPEVLRKVLTDGCWRERKISLGRVVKFERFEDFVTTKPINGLGTTMKLVKQICGEDGTLLDLLDLATVGKQGGNNNPFGRTGKPEEGINRDIVTVDSGHNEPERGNSPQYAIRKLRNDAPELHARVIAGELSPHAAMVQAGFRKRQIQIPLDPEGAARKLVRHFAPSDVARICEILQGGSGEPS